MTAPGVDDLLVDAHLVRVMWSVDPIPCFRLVFLEKLVREQWADEGGWTPERLRVKARELVARGLKVEPVDCPANVAVFYDQAAVERLSRPRTVPNSDWLRMLSEENDATVEITTAGKDAVALYRSDYPEPAAWFLLPDPVWLGFVARVKAGEFDD